MESRVKNANVCPYAQLNISKDLRITNMKAPVDNYTHTQKTFIASCAGELSPTSDTLTGVTLGCVSMVT